MIYSQATFPATWRVTRALASDSQGTPGVTMTIRVDAEGRELAEVAKHAASLVGHEVVVWECRRD